LPPTARSRVVVLRGHHANTWDLRPFERLADAYDVTVLRTGSNLHDTSGLDLRIADVRTPRDRIPGGRAAGALAYALGERVLGLEEHLRDADIVHSAELSTWFSAQAARLRARLGFRLVLTVWETLPWGRTYCWPRERRYRDAVLPATDLFLPATERARDALLLEGAPAGRCVVAPPGVDVERFGADAGARPGQRDAHVILSAGRLVWEKGHQDVLRAVAALRRGLGGPPREDVRLLIVGDGPERAKLERHAAELGLGGAVELRATVPYAEMPALHASASALVLASLPVRGWEEQFGMVLVEAMAAGTPIVSTTSGAIPEVVGDAGTLVAPGDWMGLARALRDGPLAGCARRPAADPDRLARYSADAAAGRLRDAYARLLS